MQVNAKVIGYHLEPEDMEKLRKINKRLFDDKTLTPDNRRDLANLMCVILDRIIPVKD